MNLKEEQSNGAVDEAHAPCLVCVETQAAALQIQSVLDEQIHRNREISEKLLMAEELARYQYNHIRKLQSQLASLNSSQQTG